MCRLSDGHIFFPETSFREIANVSFNVRCIGISSKRKRMFMPIVGNNKRRTGGSPRYCPPLLCAWAIWCI
jgi:hypothetical protein